MIWRHRAAMKNQMKYHYKKRYSRINRKTIPSNILGGKVSRINDLPVVCLIEKITRTTRININTSQASVTTTTSTTVSFPLFLSVCIFLGTFSPCHIMYRMGANHRTPFGRWGSLRDYRLPLRLRSVLCDLQPNSWRFR